MIRALRILPSGELSVNKAPDQYENTEQTHNLFILGMTVPSECITRFPWPNIGLTNLAIRLWSIAKHRIEYSRWHGLGTPRASVSSRYMKYITTDSIYGPWSIWKKALFRMLWDALYSFCLGPIPNLELWITNIGNPDCDITFQIILANPSSNAVTSLVNLSTSNFWFIDLVVPHMPVPNVVNHLSNHESEPWLIIFAQLSSKLFSDFRTLV